MIWFLGKTYFLLFVLIWLRSTLPRLRADQLMALCWKGLIPLALFNIALSALIVLLLPGGYELPLALINWLLLAAIVIFGPRLVYRSIGFSASHRWPAYERAPRRARPRLGPRPSSTETATDGGGGDLC